MEFRKEMIKKQLYQSDIFNIKSQYYKTENIFPITPKPNELNKTIKEFNPNFRKIRTSKTIKIDLPDNFNNKRFELNYLSFPKKRQNSEIHILRKYAKTMRDNCFDERGNFSAKKRFMFEFYGNKGRNNIFNDKNNELKLNKSIKEKRKLSIKTSNYNLKNIKDNDGELKKKNGKNKNYKRIYSCDNINIKEKNIDDNKYNHKKKLEFTPHKQQENEKINNNIDEDNIQNKFKLLKSKEKINGENNLTKNSLNIKTLNNKSRLKSNITKNKNRSENDDYYIEIKNENIDNKKSNIYVDKKRLKQIFLKNGLHLYNFNDDGANILSINSKFEAKIRKNKEDENFDKKYRNVVRELSKINIKVNRCGMVYENCIFNKNSKIRKGTPGKNLKKNNIKLNYGIKRDKYVQPQQNQDYKNGYKYNLNHFNHNKYKEE